MVKSAVKGEIPVPNKYLLFDLDGTLTDPMIGITNCVMYALEKFGIRVPDRRELYPYIGPPLTESFMKRHGLTAAQADAALAYYRERFSSTGMFENTLYEDVPSFLQTLKEEGYTLLIATSKPEEYTVQILKHFSLDGYFDFIAGNTLDESRPTKSAVIAYLRERYPDISADNAVMIGDRKYDVVGARENGLQSIGVLYGYGSQEELVTAGATALAADFEQLKQRIRELWL